MRTSGCGHLGSNSRFCPFTVVTIQWKMSTIIFLKASLVLLPEKYLRNHYTICDTCKNVTWDLLCQQLSILFLSIWNTMESCAFSVKHCKTTGKQAMETWDDDMGLVTAVMHCIKRVKHDLPETDRYLVDTLDGVWRRMEL